MVRYLDTPPSLFFGPPAELVRVRSVSPDQLQLRQLLLQLLSQELLRADTVVQTGGVNASAEYQPTGVHEQVTLPARESLGPVVAAFLTADAGGSHDLAVQDRPAGITISTLRFAYCRSESVVSLPQASVSPPLAKVVVDRLPGWVLSREHPPCAAAPQQVKGGVGYAPGVPFRGTAAPFRGREEGLQEGPFGLGKVGGIGSSASAGHGDLRLRGYTYCPRW